MAKRLVDCFLSFLAVCASMPVFIAAAVGVRLSSPGPILYRARRVGLHGKLFTMYKFRTMHLEGAPGSKITAVADTRVFPFGAWLRRLKIDEIPQFLNVMKGDMSIVGPRPEDPCVVEKYYTAAYRESLSVLPGLASPGTIYYYTRLERELNTADPEKLYADRILPAKIALDLLYIREASLFYDAAIVLRTVWVILCVVLGRRHFADPPEVRKAAILRMKKEHDCAGAEGGA